MSDASNSGKSKSACFLLGIVVAVIVVVCTVVLVAVLVPSRAKQGASKSKSTNDLIKTMKDQLKQILSSKPSKKKQGASAVNFSGDNIAEPLEYYDNVNREYETLVEMNKKRIAADLRRKKGEVSNFEVLARTLNTDTKPVSQDDVDAVSHGEEMPQLTVSSSVDQSALTTGQKAALGMYLGVGAKIEEQNDAFIPMTAEVYRG
jgi:hypothetical protein